MNTGKWIWMDGKFVPNAKAKIHVLSHALHYGTAVFEGIRAYETPQGPAIFRLGEHVNRLFRSASALGMKLPYSKVAVAGAAKKLIAKNRLRSAYIRPLVFYGEGQMGLGTKGAVLHVMVAAWPWGAYLGDHTALSLAVSRYIRFNPRSVVPGAKISGYYATSTLATLEVKSRGFDEALLLDHQGFVAEGPGENIFMIKGKKLFTPPAQNILPGITRASVMTIARDLHVPVREKAITLKELMSADEAFLTGTAAGIVPVAKINKKIIGQRAPGPMTWQISVAYDNIIHGRSPRYQRWLTAV